MFGVYYFAVKYKVSRASLPVQKVQEVQSTAFREREDGGDQGGEAWDPGGEEGGVPILIVWDKLEQGGKVHESDLWVGEVVSDRVIDMQEGESEGEEILFMVQVVRWFNDA